eukprot:TRINITY_DN51777_c0_g1_i1.p2 TRINITY_DN51777_c0_g1~~TRINITY_DN51777_c0_g1_i1.p2  ORF type:complete len:134 (-),score=17.89 TRINITY_DN51777_c0_g1_i1:72-473(-)
MCIRDSILPILINIPQNNDYLKKLIDKCKQFIDAYEKNYITIPKIQLTERELEIMRLVNQGYIQIEIANKLNIALVTVKKHISSVYCKLEVKNKIKAINILKGIGIIQKCNKYTLVQYTKCAIINIIQLNKNI